MSCLPVLFPDFYPDDASGLKAAFFCLIKTVAVVSVGQAQTVLVKSVKADGQDRFGVLLNLYRILSEEVRCEIRKEGGLVQTGEVLSGTGDVSCVASVVPAFEKRPSPYMQVTGTAAVNNLRIAGEPATFDLVLTLKTDKGAQCQVRGAFRGMTVPFRE